MKEKLQKISDYLLDIADSFIIGFVAIMVTLISIADETNPPPVLAVIVFCIIWVSTRRVVQFLDRPDDAAS